MNFTIVINKGINAVLTIYTEGMDFLLLCTGMKLNCTQQDRQERETSDNKTTTYERTTKFRCEIQMCICLNFVLIPAAVG